jgi:ABC-2 type transport system permease protein
MNWKKVKAVIIKELQDASKNKMIIGSMALVPLMLVLLTLGTAFFMLRSNTPMDSSDMAIIPQQLQHLDPVHAFLILMNDQYLFYFLLIPMMIPVYIAAYSIVGEKETKSLEPLLATPISIKDLLFAKALSATVPSVLLTWASFGVLAIGGYFIMPAEVFEALIRPVWIVGMVVLSPLLAMLSVFCGIIVSSRVNDPRSAQQITGIFVVPIIALSLVVLGGKIFLSVFIVLMAAGVTLILDGIALYFAVKLFQREVILTRWK